jgi:4-amino-4-deoxy-L-arabinose transferase-like glycosyltransferase
LVRTVLGEGAALQRPGQWAFLIIFLAALAVRLPYALTRPESLDFPDSRDYDSTARSLLAGNGFQEESGRRASRAPGYPLFLAGAYAVGLDHRGAYVLQSVADAVTCVLIALLGMRLGGRRVGLWAGAGGVIFPFFIFFSGILLAETLFMLSLVGAVLLLEGCLRRYAEAPRRAVVLAALAGVAAGCGVHLRSSFILFPFFLLPFWLIISTRRARAFGLWVVMTVLVAVVLAPWVVRNYRLFHHVIPTTLQVGESLYEANSPYADGGPAMDRIDWVEERGGVMMGEFENNEYYKNKALEYIREHPGRTVALAFEKMRRFWNPMSNHSPYRRPLYAAVGLLANVPIYLLAIVGLVRWRKRRAEIALLLTPVLYYAGLHAVFVGSVRYRVPVMPFLIVLAAAGLAGLFRGRTADEGEAAHG